MAASFSYAYDVNWAPETSYGPGSDFFCREEHGFRAGPNYTMPSGTPGAGACEPDPCADHGAPCPAGCDERLNYPFDDWAVQCVTACEDRDNARCSGTMNLWPDVPVANRTCRTYRCPRGKRRKLRRRGSFRRRYASYLNDTRNTGCVARVPCNDFVPANGGNQTSCEAAACNWIDASACDDAWIYNMTPACYWEKHPTCVDGGNAHSYCGIWDSEEGCGGTSCMWVNDTYCIPNPSYRGGGNPYVNDGDDDAAFDDDGGPLAQVLSPADASTYFVVVAILLYFLTVCADWRVRCQRISMKGKPIVKGWRDDVDANNTFVEDLERAAVVRVARLQKMPKGFEAAKRVWAALLALAEQGRYWALRVSLALGIASLALPNVVRFRISVSFVQWTTASASRPWHRRDPLSQVDVLLLHAGRAAPDLGGGVLAEGAGVFSRAPREDRRDHRRALLGDREPVLEVAAAHGVPDAGRNSERRSPFSIVAVAT